MHRSSNAARAALVILAAAPMAVRAQQMPNPYGENIGVEAAKKAAEAALSEGKKNGWKLAAAVVDTHGTLVYFERMDDVQYGSIHVAQEKAKSAAEFRRATKVFEDGVKGQAVNLLGLPGAVPLEGGIPIVLNGKIVGALGVSGATSAQDGQCAKAGIEALTGGAAKAEATSPAPAKR
jgi:uncharacterized protein GlcG (DUF336 family)